MATEITRRMRNGILSETVHAWHFRKEGPGEPGGRTYDAIYAPNGMVRIDVSDQSGSSLRTVILGASQVRPRDEWLTWLAETGQVVAETRWCMVDGLEIDQDSNPEFDGDCCSPGCRMDMRPEF